MGVDSVASLLPLPPPSSPMGRTSELIHELVKRKRDVDEKLLSLEKQIYELEGAYLTETQKTGNCLKGWENYLHAAREPKDRVAKKPNVKDSDRVFSLSSVTSPASLAVNGEPQRVKSNESNKS